MQDDELDAAIAEGLRSPVPWWAHITARQLMVIFVALEVVAVILLVLALAALSALVD